MTATMITLETLKGSMCKWPIGDPRHDDFHFCGSRREAEASYCSKHIALAYRRAEPRGARKPMSRRPTPPNVTATTEKQIEDAAPAVQETKKDDKKEAVKKDTQSGTKKKSTKKTAAKKTTAKKTKAKAPTKKTAKKPASKSSTTKKKAVKKVTKKAAKKKAA